MDKIYVIGDSISMQYGPYLARMLDGIMIYARKVEADEADLGLEDPQGANGGDSSMVRRFLEASAAAGGIDADLMLVNCGLHDIKTDPATAEKQVPLVQYEENLRAIVDCVRGMGPDLVWIRTSPCDEDVHNSRATQFHRFAADGEAYNEAADRIMAAAGVPSIDLFNFTQNLGPDIYCDHVHLHEHIREKQGAFIAGWLDAWRALDHE